jgi:hypothetical protein
MEKPRGTLRAVWRPTRTRLVRPRDGRDRPQRAGWLRSTGAPAQVHRRDAARVGDVVERIGVEHDEVGALARMQRAGVGDPQELGGVAGRRHDDLHGRHSGGHHVERAAAGRG